MIGEYRIVPFIPAGRQRVMSLLIDNLRRFPMVDEVQVWLNTDDSQVDDIAWIRSLPGQWDKIRVIELGNGDRSCSCWQALNGQHSNHGSWHRPKQLNTGKFYPYTIDPDAIYFRFDDDVVYIDDGYFENMVAFRVAHPEYFLVMGNIWNNAFTSYLHQQAGRIGQEYGLVQSAYCMDMVGWQSGPFAHYIHLILLERIAQGTTSDLYFDHHDLDGKRFSISNFCFFGRDFAEFGGVLPMLDEEIWLTEVAGRRNTICGRGLVAHYSFFGQRDFLDTTNVLPAYAAVARQKLSENYYTLLGQAV